MRRMVAAHTSPCINMSVQRVKATRQRTAEAARQNNRETTCETYARLPFPSRRTNAPSRRSVLRHLRLPPRAANLSTMHLPRHLHQPRNAISSRRMRRKQTGKTTALERIRNHHGSHRLVPRSGLHRHSIHTHGNLIQRRSQRLRIPRQPTAILIRVIFTRTRNSQLHQRRSNRRKNSGKNHTNRANQPRRLITITTTTAKIHQRITQIRNHRRHGRRNRRRKNVMVIHMHQLMPKHATQLATIENTQNPLRTAHRRMTLVTTGGKRVGTFGRRDINARHRLARPSGKLAHNLIDLRRFLLTDLMCTHRSDGKFIGKPVRPERSRQTNENVNTEGIAAGTSAQPDEHDNRPHQREKKRCLQAIAMAMYTHFGIHVFSLKRHPERLLDAPGEPSERTQRGILHQQGAVAHAAC